MNLLTNNMKIEIYRESFETRTIKEEVEEIFNYPDLTLYANK